MTIVWQRRLRGQTPFGILQNIFISCEPIKYLAFHVWQTRLTLYWGTE